MSGGMEAAFHAAEKRAKESKPLAMPFIYPTHDEVLEQEIQQLHVRVAKLEELLNMYREQR